MVTTAAIPAASVRIAAAAKPGVRPSMRMPGSCLGCGLAQIARSDNLCQSTARATMSHMKAQLQRRPRGRAGAAPLVAVDTRSRGPIYEQIYGTVRDQIVRGDWRPGARVASTRTLARELSVSRFTVVTAVERLLAEGYLATRRGSGTFVASALPEQAMHARPQRGGPAHAAAASRAPRLSVRGEALSAV